MNNKTLTRKVTAWIRDEADKELLDGYICIIGGDAEKAEREEVSKEDGEGDQGWHDSLSK